MKDPFSDIADLLGGLGKKPSGFDASPLGQAAKAAEANAKKNRALPQVRGKTIDGVLYVRADDVAAALESQGISGPIVDKLKGKKP